jgi:hypothetical protein
MSDGQWWLGQSFEWAARLVGLYLIWLIVRHMKPSLSFRGWGTLRREFGFAKADLPATLSMRGTEVRVGIYKTDMARIGLDDNFIYLDRPFSSSANGILRIPFHRLELVSAPSASGGLFKLPVAGIFKVNGVEVWLGSPFADEIMRRIA